MSTLDEARLEPASPRELKGLMRDWRKGRATRNLMEAFNDAYVAVIGALDDRRDAHQRRAEGPAHRGRVHDRVLPVGADRPALGRVCDRRGRRAGRPAGCSARCSPRPPRDSGCWTRPISRAKLLGARLVGAVVIGTVGGP